MEKRGLSSIVSVVLIVLIAIAAIAIVWSFFGKNITQSGQKAFKSDEEIILSQSRFSIVAETLNIDANDNISFVLKRVSGNGNVTGVYIILTSKGEQTAMVKKEIFFGVGEAKWIQIGGTEYSLLDVASIGVFPFFGSDNGEIVSPAVTGELKDLNLNSSSGNPPAGPCAGKNEGDNCTGGYCIGGICQNETMLGYVPINSCPGTSGWVSGKTYKLVSDINMSLTCSSNCFDIKNSSVVLDGQNHLVDGKNRPCTLFGSVGFNNIYLKNIRLFNTSYAGVVLFYSENSSLVNVTVSYTSQSGIAISGSNNTLIDNARASYCLQSGIFINGPAQNITLKNSVLTNITGGGGASIYLYGLKDFNLINTSVTRSLGSYAISMTSVNFTMLRDNTLCRGTTSIDWYCGDTNNNLSASTNNVFNRSSSDCGTIPGKIAAC